MGAKPEDIRVPYNEYNEVPWGGLDSPPTPAMYNQDYVDNLKMEIEHYKKLYRNELVTSQALRRKVKNGKRS